MKKLTLALFLTLTLTVYTFAGDTPIMNFTGCEGGAWYPDSQVCCMPNEQCPVGRPAPALPNNAKDNILSGLITMFHDIWF